MEEKKVVEEAKEETSNTEKEVQANEVVLSKHDHKMLDHDIKYRGPLSYRHFKLIGWIAMAIMFVSLMIGTAVNIRGTLGGFSESQIEGLTKASEILSYFSALPLPMFLIANFAIILQSKNNYKKLLLKYLKLFLAIYIGAIILYYHYVVILIMKLEECSFIDARSKSIELYTELGKQHGLVVNVFVDLLCCALIMFFIDYTPKKYFQGKKIIIFRLLALLPFLYEAGSAVLMGFLGANSALTDFKFSLPPEILPLIGKKPIGMIFGFVLICIYVKIRERLYLKRGGTPEGYELYVKTNRNSFRLSLMMAVTFFIIAVIDLLVVLIPVLNVSKGNPDSEQAMTLLNVLNGFTIGKSACLLFVVPFILLFSYTKKHDNEKLDKLLPVIGIVLVIFAIIETLFFALLF